MSRTGHGIAHGAITILNATATGRGCSLAIDAPTVASWSWEGRSIAWPGPMDDALVQAVWKRMQGLLGRTDGAAVTCQSRLPPARGLKTSSAAATAMVQAAIEAADAHEDPVAQQLTDICIDAAIDAGVTLTGAFDDQVAVERGGCHLTDNARREVIADIRVPAQHVAIWVPQIALPKAIVAKVDARVIAPQIEAAEALLVGGDVGAAMTANGNAFATLYQQAGLPIDTRAARAAMAHGALGAGLSGTGPAIAALFEDVPDLPGVPGGVWQNFEVAP